MYDLFFETMKIGAVSGTTVAASCNPHFCDDIN